jgi:hypothetical protein
MGFRAALFKNRVSKHHLCNIGPKKTAACDDRRRVFSFFVYKKRDSINSLVTALVPLMHDGGEGKARPIPAKPVSPVPEQ